MCVRVCVCACVMEKRLTNDNILTRVSYIHNIAKYIFL